MKTIQNLYEKNKETPLSPFLTDYDALFWSVYKENHNYFDNYFKTRYKSFIFFDQEEYENVDDVLTRFKTIVYSHLLLNDKRYSELFRVQIVPDDESYSITENYYMSETYNENRDNQGTSMSGQRTDVNNFEQGNQKLTNLNSVSAFNSSNLNSKDKAESETGTRNDRTEFTQGGQEFTNHTTDANSHTLVRHGALGVMTVTDVLSKQVTFWRDAFNFYNIIFDEICENYLLVGC